MPSRALVVLVAALGLSAPLAGQSSQAVPSDSALLQGVWAMVSGATSGTPVPDEFVRATRRVAKGREVTVTWEKEQYFKATVTLNPAARPKTVDYRLIGGPSDGALQLGIYSIAGDTLRFCFAAPGSPRPTDFTTVADDGRTLSVWVRRKE